VEVEPVGLGLGDRLGWPVGTVPKGRSQADKVRSPRRTVSRRRREWFITTSIC
jgi:hypothetical protein